MILFIVGTLFAGVGTYYLKQQHRRALTVEEQEGFSLLMMGLFCMGTAVFDQIKDQFNSKIVFSLFFFVFWSVFLLFTQAKNYKKELLSESSEDKE